MAPTSKEVWLKEGLAVLAEAGHRNLTIAILCDRLNLTTGSFYHHFKNRQAYSEAVLQYWEKGQTQRFIEQSEAQPDIQSKKNKLLEMALQTSLAHEPAIRAWACPATRISKRGFQSCLDSTTSPARLSMDVKDGLLRGSFRKFSYWAGKFTDQWCRKVMRSRIEPMKKIARMPPAHKPLLMNWFGAGNSLWGPWRA